MKRPGPFLLLPALAVSCATGSANPQVSAMTFETGVCFGTCPSFTLTIDAEGNGTFTGRNFVAAIGSHTFTASAEEFAAFRDRLAPFRPEGAARYDFENCDGDVSTDQPSVSVGWQDAKGTDVLDWYMGCPQPGLVEHEETIYRAWEELPVGELVGTAEDRRQYRKVG